MKRAIVYALTVGILLLLFAVLGSTVGIQARTGECPEGTVDCSASYTYSPVFWLPMIIVAGGFSSNVWPGAGASFQPILFASLAYWFIAANFIALLVLKLFHRALA